ncbi:MAG: hypothetical protein ACRYG8_41975 [Janthinobacterium lividum]
MLIVEDNVEVIQFASQILKDLGYTTTWTTNGKDSLDHFKRGEAFDIAAQPFSSAVALVAIVIFWL